MVKSSCACALTCKEARENGVRRETGECVMTKIAYDVEGYNDAPPPPYTCCNGCKKRVCLDCWECMADKFDEIVRAFNTGWALAPNVELVLKKILNVVEGCQSLLLTLFSGLKRT